MLQCVCACIRLFEGGGARGRGFGGEGKAGIREKEGETEAGYPLSLPVQPLRGQSPGGAKRLVSKKKGVNSFSVGMFV